MKSGNRLLFILAFLGIILLSGCAKYSGQPAQPSTPSQIVEKTNVIEITESGFSPRTLSIRAGETVVFVNKDINPHWPASAVHPTHTVYPESGGCIGSKFDACRGLAQGETFSFKFDKIGRWKYHDHLNPSLTGEIVVE
ncbi:MAG: cupredoxin domain-containing protein [Candidatus Woesearchaeota archaeon]